MWGSHVKGTKAKGAHKSKALTAAAIRNLKEPGFYGDGEGLYLKVDANGKQRWIQRIVIQGKRKDIGLGSARLVSLAEARDIALGNRKLARQGRDPIAERRNAQSIVSFEQAARKVYERDSPNWRNPKHRQQWISTLERYAFPIFGKKRIDEIGSGDVLNAITPIWQTRPETAKRVFQRINFVMEWAISNGWRKDNPATDSKRGLPKQNHSVNHMPFVPYPDVPNAIKAVRNSNALPSTKLALEFLILTATRSQETRGARWKEISVEEALWTIPPERMKTNCVHNVPLSKRCLEILKEAENLKRNDSDLVFPGMVEGKPLSDMTLSKLMKELGLEGVPHGFRTSFKTWADEETHGPTRVADTALSHKIKDKVEAAYSRSDVLPKRRKLLNEWAEYLEKENH